MTLAGALGKTVMLWTLSLLCAGLVWRTVGESAVCRGGFLLGGAVGASLCAGAACFGTKWSWLAGPAFALFEGGILGSGAALLAGEWRMDVFWLAAIGCGTPSAVLAMYCCGWIRPECRHRSLLLGIGGGLCLSYALAWGARSMAVEVPYFHESGGAAMLLGLGVAAAFSINLLLDLGAIEDGVMSRAPKHMEWYSAFAVLVSVLWILVEVLRVLSSKRKIRF